MSHLLIHMHVHTLEAETTIDFCQSFSHFIVKIMWKMTGRYVHMAEEDSPDSEKNYTSDQMDLFRQPDICKYVFSSY